MYLSNIKLWNFRKYGSIDKDLSSEGKLSNPDLDLNFTKGLNVLIGANDSGKTAILDAIKLVLKTNTSEWIKFEKDDFYNGTKKLRIELRFDNLKVNEAKNFASKLSLEGEGQDIKEFLIINCDVSRNDERIFQYDLKAGYNGDLGILSSEERDFLEVTYLKPLRDVKTELIPKRGSRLSTILESHEAFKGKNDVHILMDIFNDFNTSIEKYFEGLDKDDYSLPDDNGKKLKQKIDEFIKDFLERKDEGVFGVNPGDLKNILEKLELKLKNNINPGLGSLNRLFIASELLHLQRNNYDGLELGLIEEIEAHIHPQAQMKIIESLQNKNTQLIITTHSPNLASKVKLENLIICCNNNAFPMGKAYTNLKEGDYRFLERFLDVTKSNLFFSEGVILVEGWAEEIILPSFARLLKRLGVIDKDLTEAQVSIVNVGSDTFFRYAKVFERKVEPYMNKKVSIVTDLDLRPDEYKTNSNIQEKLSGKTDPIEIKGILKSNNIISGYEQTEIDDEISKKTITNLEQNIKTFLTKQNDWTLEYSLGLFEKFQEFLFKSIKKSIVEMRENSTYSRGEETRDFVDITGSNEKKSFEIYNGILLKKKVSKTIVAQYFSEFLEEEINKIELNEDGTIKINGSIFERSDFESDSSILYLINAIKHVI